MPPWSGCALAESSLPCSGPTMAPTRWCTVDCAPLPSGSGTERRSSPPAVSSPARMIGPSPVSHTARADRPVPVRRPSQPPTAMVVHPPPSGSRFQTCWCLRLSSDPRRSSMGTRTVFILPCGGVFACPWMTSPSQPPQNPPPPPHTLQRHQTLSARLDL
jgi:hypothetical protein